MKRPLALEGLSGYPEDSEIDRKGEKKNKSKWPRKNTKSHKENGMIPSGVTNFVIGLIGRCGH